MTTGDIGPLERGGFVPKPVVIAAVQNYLHEQEEPVTAMKVTEDLKLAYPEIAHTALTRLCIKGLAKRRQVTMPKVYHTHRLDRPTGEVRRVKVRRPKLIWVYEAVQER